MYCRPVGMMVLAISFPFQLPVSCTANADRGGSKGDTDNRELADTAMVFNKSEAERILRSEENTYHVRDIIAEGEGQETIPFGRQDDTICSDILNGITQLRTNSYAGSKHMMGRRLCLLRHLSTYLGWSAVFAMTRKPHVQVSQGTLRR